MPELPEVETIKNGLKQKLLDKTICKAKINRPNLRNYFPDDFTNNLNGRTITDFSRRSKYLLTELDEEFIWISHFGMSGKYTIEDHNSFQQQKHDHVIITFSDKTLLVYNDPRRFGLMDFCHKKDLAEHSLLKNLAPEPLSESFDLDYLSNKLNNRSINIKNAIMNAHFIVGVGNIYACESLYKCAISPTRKCNDISTSEINMLVKTIKSTLQDAINAGGSTLKDYRQADGTLGYFQHSFNVYGKENEPCNKCNKPIERIVQQGRSTFFCSTCQI